MASTDGESIDDTLTSPNTPGPTGSGPALPTALAGRYALLNELGQGGGGRVYRAFDRELERYIAIKVLKSRSGSGSEVLSTRLRREAQANALLQHPNVVSVFDVGEHEGEVFIAMEYVDGGSLADWLKGPRPRKEVLDRFLQAGRGLLAAHEKGIIHRDFKPSNVLVGADRRVRVADFGLARGLGGEPVDGDSPDAGSPSPGLVDRALTKTGAIVGTPAYMAPEQFEGHMVDARADQFSFCLVLAEALTGTKAPRGELTESGWRTTNFQPKDWLRGRRLSTRLREALIRGLSADPERRFASLEPILDILHRELDRGRKRTTLFAVGGMSAVAVGVIATAALTAPEPPCEGLDQPIRQVWNPERKAAFERALAPAPQPGRQAVASAIDLYAEEWAATRTDVCTATHVRGEQSEERLDARMACLDRQLESLRLVLALVDTKRLNAVEPAADAVLRLERPESCRLAVGPGRERGSAIDPARAEQVKVAERALTELQALAVGGFTSSGLQQAEAAANLARQTEHPLIEARAAEWLGRMLAANDRFAEATAAFERAELLAEAAGDDARRLAALVELIRLDQGSAATSTSTDRHVARAHAVLGRQAGTALQRSTLSAALGQLSFRRGDLVACRRHGEQAMLHLEQAPEPPLSTRLRLSADLALCLERLGLRRDAAAVMRSSLAVAEERLGAMHPRIGELNIQLSRAFDFSGNRAGARAAAKRAVEISMATLGGRHSQTARAYQALANVMYREGSFEDSRTYLLRAIEVMQRVHGPLSHQVGGLTSSLGLTLSQLDRKDDAHRAHQRAVRILSADLGPRHPFTAAAIGRMGANQQAQGQCEAAIRHCRRAMRLLRQSDPDHARILDQVRCVAGCLIQLGRHREAIAPLEAGLMLSQRRDEPADYTARLEFLAAQALWVAGQRSRALALAELARSRLEPTGEHRATVEKIVTWQREREP